MPTRPRTDPPSRLVRAPAPALCLDFANTRYWRGTPAPTETLPDYPALARWLVEAGVVDADTAGQLRALRELDPGAAGQLFAAALDLRELLYRLFSGLAAGAPAPADVQALGRVLDATPPRQHWRLDGERSGWQVPMASPDVGEVLAPVLWSAADLALAAHRLPLRACANERCRWLFLDDSKGGTRRWCSMSTCGNRAKVHRHAQRRALQRAAAAGG